MMTKRKRVLAVITTPFYREKGSSMRVHAILSLLGEEYDVDAVTYPHGRDVDIDGVTLHRAARRFVPTVGIAKASVGRILLDVLVLLQALKLALRHRYEVIHCEDFEALAIGRVIRLVRPRAKLVNDMHNPLPDNLYRTNSPRFVVSIARIVDRWVVRTVDLFILNWSTYESEARYTNRRHFVYYDRVTLALSTSGDSIDVPYILYAGNFESYQGVESLLEAYGKARPSFKLVLVGALPSHFRKLLSDHQLNDSVFTTGSLSVEQANMLISRSLAFVVPRIDDSRIPSMKLVHALVNGIPVIASDLRCNHELLEDGYNARFYANCRGLVKLLQSIDEDPTVLNSLQPGVDETRGRILSSWSSARFLREYRRVFHNAED